MATVPLGEIAFARPGDKDDVSDVTVFAPDRAVYDVLAEQLTPERVKALMGGFVTGAVQRYEVPNVLALKLVMEGGLGGGGPSSLRADNLGKALGGAVLRLPVEIPDDLPRLPGPPRDPYAGAVWVMR